MHFRLLLLALVLVAVAGKLVQLGITREGVGPFEYLTLALLVTLLLQSASTPVALGPWRSSASADAASASSVSGGQRSSTNLTSQRRAARS